MPHSPAPRRSSASSPSATACARASRLQEAELARLRSANEGVRRRFAMLHQRYVELAKKILGQLEQFDGLIRETGQEALSETSRQENGRHEEPMVLEQQRAGRQ